MVELHPVLEFDVIWRCSNISTFMKSIYRCTNKSIFILVQVVISFYCGTAITFLHFPHYFELAWQYDACIKNILHNSCFFIYSSIFILSWIYLQFWKSIMYSCGNLVLKCFVGVSIFMYDVVYSVFVFQICIVKIMRINFRRK